MSTGLAHEKHIKRHISHALDRYASSFPAVLITGRDRRAKTTYCAILKEADTSISYITFDDPAEQLSAVSDKLNVFTTSSNAGYFDEIQYVPQLFPYLKMAIDKDRHNGMFMYRAVSSFISWKISVKALPVASAFFT